MLLGILALLFGTVILATWYIQTFTDTSYGLFIIEGVVGV